MLSVWRTCFIKNAPRFSFNLKKSGVDGYRMLRKVYGEHAPPVKTCNYRFRRFKKGDLHTSHKGFERRSVSFEIAVLVVFLHRDCCQTQKKLTDTLGVTQQAISKQFLAITTQQNKQIELRINLSQETSNTVFSRVNKCCKGALEVFFALNHNWGRKID